MVSYMRQIKNKPLRERIAQSNTVIHCSLLVVFTAVTAALEDYTIQYKIVVCATNGKFRNAICDLPREKRTIQLKSRKSTTPAPPFASCRAELLENNQSKCIHRESKQVARGRFTAGKRYGKGRGWERNEPCKRSERERRNLLP